VIIRKNKGGIIKTQNGSEKLIPRRIKRIKRSGRRTVKDMKIVIRIAIPHDTDKFWRTGSEQLIRTVKVIESGANGRRGNRRTRKGRSAMGPGTGQNSSKRQFFPALTGATNQDRFSLQ